MRPLPGPHRHRPAPGRSSEIPNTCTSDIPCEPASRTARRAGFARKHRLPNPEIAASRSLLSHIRERRSHAACVRRYPCRTLPGRSSRSIRTCSRGLRRGPCLRVYICISSLYNHSEIPSSCCFRHVQRLRRNRTHPAATEVPAACRPMRRSDHREKEGDAIHGTEAQEGHNERQGSRQVR